MRTVRTLLPPEMTAYRDHLLRLSAEDRRLRFGCAMKDEAIAAAVARISVFETRVMAVFAEDLRVVAAVQVTRIGPARAECAFSVEPGYRRQGLGTLLMQRALLWARNRGLFRVHVFCLRENIGMRRLAVRAGIPTTAEGSEFEGDVHLAMPSAATAWCEALAEAQGLAEFANGVVDRGFRRLLEPPQVAAAMGIAGQM